mmetsp:Transcript_10945/g.20974  ORF Transcript_10945/g.20974 Transcript_10945/m.20974 type:complete len:171 (+) Transcript_10945:103-615(+)
MGQSTSSLRNIDNDYELVIRVSKLLEQKLKDEFDLEGSISQQIDQLDGYVERQSLRDMKQLVSWRNKLVHDPEIHSLTDLGVTRTDFHRRFEKALYCLRQCNHPGRRRQIMPGPYSIDDESSTTRTVHLGGWGLLAAGVIAGGLALAVASAADDDGACEDSRTRRNRGTR